MGYLHPARTPNETDGTTLLPRLSSGLRVTTPAPGTETRIVEALHHAIHELDQAARAAVATVTGSDHLTEGHRVPNAPATDLEELGERLTLTLRNIAATAETLSAAATSVADVDVARQTSLDHTLRSLQRRRPSLAYRRPIPHAMVARLLRS